MMQTCLMLGSGHSPLERRLWTGRSETPCKWVTLDVNPACKPDFVFDLGMIERGTMLPFPAETFDEIHAYEVLEHFGQQGDHEGFFNSFREFWRVLKPGGCLFGTSPRWNSFWAWGDPGHRRVISEGALAFLRPGMYADLGHGPASDYRKFVEPCWWNVDTSPTIGGGLSEDTLYFTLEKIRALA